MKKVFVEPSMRKIELNLSENIAESGSDYKGLHFEAHYTVCTITDTRYTMDSELPNLWVLMGCISNIDDGESEGTVLPVDTFRMIKRV